MYFYFSFLLVGATGHVFGMKIDHTIHKQAHYTFGDWRELSLGTH